MSEASEKHDIIPKQKLHAYQNPWRKLFLYLAYTVASVIQSKSL